MKSTDRFSGLADIYAASRPTYPVEAIEFIVRRCGLSNQSLVADIGCGTGISTRLFADRGIKLIGLEPNDDMRLTAQRAEEQSRASDATGGDAASEDPEKKNPVYIPGTAEDTGLPDAHVDAVLSAQAFHWFDPDKALIEFHRIIKPGGYVVLMWNERNEIDEFSKGYGDLFRQLPETTKVEMKRGIAGNPLLESTLFKDAARTNFGNFQRMDLNGLLGRAFSASYAPKDGAAADALRAGLTALFGKFQRDGFADLQYETSVFIAKR
ncbi:MAG: class I SAM-dependent methyltransferase [Candidatus Melainabacteria bacterium]|nr:class I SAM-dependent methyltransferase [Candidatus Melainabacteria bacterium]